jgi:predicted negative regulator of RcsB-dependent stress response
VELYDTEEQQVEAIKSWWQENGKAVIIGTAVGLSAIGGWNYYQSSVQDAKESASVSYESTITELSKNGLAVQDSVQTFIDANSGSEYASLAAIQLAKAQIEANDLDGALRQLEWVKSESADSALKTIAGYRIARIDAEQGRYDDALAELTSITDEGWQGRVLELKGDISLAKGDKDAAYIAYTEAQQKNDASQLLKLKLDDLTK